MLQIRVCPESQVISTYDQELEDRRIPSTPFHGQCKSVASVYVGAQSCLTATPKTVAHLAPLSLGFPRQEYWNGLPFPSPGDLPDPGIEPMSLKSPALAGRFFTTNTTWEALPGHQPNSPYISVQNRKQKLCSPVNFSNNKKD